MHLYLGYELDHYYLGHETKQLDLISWSGECSCFLLLFFLSLLFFFKEPKEVLWENDFERHCTKSCVYTQQMLNFYGKMHFKILRICLLRLFWKSFELWKIIGWAKLLRLVLSNVHLYLSVSQTASGDKSDWHMEPCRQLWSAS